MFFGAHSFNQSLTKWDVSNVTNMREMFLYANSFNQDLSNWHITENTNMTNMFTPDSNLMNLDYQPSFIKTKIKMLSILNKINKNKTILPDDVLRKITEMLTTSTKPQLIAGKKTVKKRTKRRNITRNITRNKQR